MPWVPTTDFEEEVVNLQPHHDFVYGTLSEPQYSYPRPKAHTEYAANKKLQYKEQQNDYQSTGKISGKLHAIQQVQRMANTKPVGEQPSLDDWENNTKIEQETIGMMRYCGMGVSVEQPLDQKATIATFPVENNIKVVQNGRRKVALFFDENVFRLKEKVSDTSSGFESCNNSSSSCLEKSKNDSVASELETESSFATSDSSLSLNSFTTVDDVSDSFSSISSTKKSLSSHKQSQRKKQYDKLIEHISFLSLDSNDSSQQLSSESFETAKEASWKPIYGQEEDVFNKQTNWPVLSKKDTRRKISLSNNDESNNSQSDLTDDVSSEASSNNHTKGTNFLDRFIKSENPNTSNTSETSSSTTSQEPSTYAKIAKAQPQSLAKSKQKLDTSSNFIGDFQPFYTTRKMYALKRNVK